MGISEQTPLSQTIGYRLIKVGEMVMETAEQVLAPTGIKPRHFNVLSTLSVDATLSQRELSTALGIDPNVMVDLIDELERQGFARRERSPVDRRRHIVVVTPKGKAVLTKAQAAVNEAEERVLGVLTSDQRQVLFEAAGVLLGLAPVPRAG
ncbi:MarR family winged helix-turn-helix transcriptional regulator [Arthrobacter pascens]|uniref:MarR family winged helix-turn-helix transcriptional regulator n=1 Tax=Arthrobacter pascens TaxID=1677 RepID=UPI0027D8F4F7|nr:MarR family transcriptional regulator [Arthrobacter pascens]